MKIRVQKHAGTDSFPLNVIANDSARLFARFSADPSFGFSPSTYPPPNLACVCNTPTAHMSVERLSYIYNDNAHSDQDLRFSFTGFYTDGTEGPSPTFRVSGFLATTQTPI